MLRCGVCQRSLELTRGLCVTWVRVRAEPLGGFAWMAAARVLGSMSGEMDCQGAQCRLETKSPAGPNPRDPSQSWVLAAIDVSTFEVNWPLYMHARTASVALGSCPGLVGSDQLID